MTRLEISDLVLNYDEKTGYDFESAFDKLLEAFMLVQSQRNGSHRLAYTFPDDAIKQDDAEVRKLLTKEVGNEV